MCAVAAGPLLNGEYLFDRHLRVDVEAEPLLPGYGEKLVESFCDMPNLRSLSLGPGSKDNAYTMLDMISVVQLFTRWSSVMALTRVDIGDLLFEHLILGTHRETKSPWPHLESLRILHNAYRTPLFAENIFGDLSSRNSFVVSIIVRTEPFEDLIKKPLRKPCLTFSLLLRS